MKLWKFWGPAHSHWCVWKFALVCLVTDTSNGEDVAIKKLEDIFRHELYVERVIREVVIHRKISHPFVVTLKGIM